MSAEFFAAEDGCNEALGVLERCTASNTTTRQTSSTLHLELSASIVGSSGTHP